MTFRERLNAKEADWGTILKNWGGKGLMLVGAVGEISNMAGLIPQDFVLPSWARATIVACGVINFLVGKMSVKKAE